MRDTDRAALGRTAQPARTLRSTDSIESMTSIAGAPVHNVSTGRAGTWRCAGALPVMTEAKQLAEYGQMQHRDNKSG
jgi:hypothetical protein